MSKFNIWIILLIISVLINGVLIGASARTWLASPEPAAVQSDRTAGPRGACSMRTFMRALPDDRRADVRARFEAARPELRELGREAWRARQQAQDALRAEPFDPDAARAATAEARAARARLEARSEAVILEALAYMDPETRTQVIEATFTPHERSWRGRRGDRPRGDGPR
ncbi:MAG: periplasmic heavy metal sensor [Oceanicaulis sp.]|nr:periplasmic heavy metal sensor [Oceanicaulis sp.]